MKLFDSKRVADFITWVMKNLPNLSKWLSENFVTVTLVTVGALVAAALIAAALRAIVTTVTDKTPDGFTTRGLRKAALRTFAMGVILGRVRFTPLRVYSIERQQGHILIIGPPGSAKTTGFYLPTLRAWRGHFAALDAAGDIVPALIRADLLVYEPNNPDTATYNVFYAADIETTTDAKNARLAELAAALVPTRNSESYYFFDNARVIIEAALVAFYHQGEDFIPIVNRVYNAPTLDSLIDDIEATGNTAALRMVAGLRGQNEKNTAGVRGELQNALKVFGTNGRVAASLRRGGGLSPAVLETNSLVISVPPGQLEAVYAPLCRLILSQIISYLNGRAIGSKKILLAIDELPKFGGIDLLGPLETLRKFGVRVMAVCQSLSDLERIYGKANMNAMLDNFSYQILAGATGNDTIEYYSKLAGEIRVKNKSTVRRVTAEGGESGERLSENTAERWERLLKYRDIATLAARKEAIIFHPRGVARLKVTPSFKDRGYKRRAKKQAARDKAIEHSQRLAASCYKECEVQKKLRQGELVEVYAGRHEFRIMTPTEAEVYHAKREAERREANERENNRCMEEYLKMIH